MHSRKAKARRRRERTFASRPVTVRHSPSPAQTIVISGCLSRSRNSAQRQALGVYDQVVAAIGPLRAVAAARILPTVSAASTAWESMTVATAPGARERALRMRLHPDPGGCGRSALAALGLDWAG